MTTCVLGSGRFNRHLPGNPPPVRRRCVRTDSCKTVSGKTRLNSLLWSAFYLICEYYVDDTIRVIDTFCCLSRVHQVRRRSIEREMWLVPSGNETAQRDRYRFNSDGGRSVRHDFGYRRIRISPSRRWCILNYPSEVFRTEMTVLRLPGVVRRCAVGSDRVVHV